MMPKVPTTSPHRAARRNPPLPPARALPAALFVIVAALLLPGCSQAQPLPTPSSTGVVRIVSSFPSRGSTAQQTREIEEALRAALTERGGKAGDTPVELVTLDDSDQEMGDWSRPQELANATTAANDPSVVAYIGPYNSGAAMLAIPITSRAGLLEISPSATWPGLTQGGWDTGEPDKYYPTGLRTFLRMMPPDSMQAAAAAQWAASNGNWSMAIMQDGSSYSAGMAHEFESAAKSLGISVTNNVPVEPDSPAPIASPLGSPRAVFYAPSSAPFAVRIARALQNSGLPMYTTDTALDPQFVAQAGAAATKWNIVSNSSSIDSEGQYASTTHPGRSFPTQFAANAYDAENIVLDGIASGAAKDRKALATYVQKAMESRGGAQVRLFDDAGDPEHWTMSGFVVTPAGLKLARTFEGTGQGVTTKAVP